MKYHRFSVEYMAPFGHERKLVEVGSVFGTGELQCHVYINKRFYGSLVIRNGEWVLHSNKPELQTADVMILGDLIDAVLLIAG